MGMFWYFMAWLTCFNWLNHKFPFLAENPGGECLWPETLVSLSYAVKYDLNHTSKSTWLAQKVGFEVVYLKSNIQSDWDAVAWPQSDCLCSIHRLGWIKIALEHEAPNFKSLCKTESKLKPSNTCDSYLLREDEKSWTSFKVLKRRVSTTYQEHFNTFLINNFALFHSTLLHKI